MSMEPTSSMIAEVLPGRWRILASNLLHWLSGERMHPVIDLEISSVEPLIIAEELRFQVADGKRRVERSRAVWKGDSFVARASGIRRPGGHRWSLSGASDDGSIVVVRHHLGRATRAGIDVMVRDGADAGQVRALVGRDFDAFRLSLEEFASLGWLPEARGAD